MIKQAFVASVVCGCGLAVAGSRAPLFATQDSPQPPPAARNYWAFKLPVQAPVPEGAARFENPIDRFLEQARRAERSRAGAARRSSSRWCAAPIWT